MDPKKKRIFRRVVTEVWEDEDAALGLIDEFEDDLDDESEEYDSDEELDAG